MSAANVEQWRELLATCEPSQPDLVKEVRIHLARLVEATDREIIASARSFAEWMVSVPLPDASTCPAICTVDTSE